MAKEHTTTTTVPALIEEEAKGYQRASKAANTIRAYRSDWAAFSSWCDSHGVSALPASPTTLAVYLAEAARTLKPSTLTRRCSSVSMAHQMAGYESPTKDIVVRTTLAGIRREKGTAADQKSPILTADLRTMVAVLPDTLAGARDRALLLLGFAGALRRCQRTSGPPGGRTPNLPAHGEQKSRWADS